MYKSNVPVSLASKPYDPMNEWMYSNACRQTYFCFVFVIKKHENDARYSLEKRSWRYFMYSLSTRLGARFIWIWRKYIGINCRAEYDIVCSYQKFTFRYMIRFRILYSVDQKQLRIGVLGSVIYSWVALKWSELTAYEWERLAQIRVAIFLSQAQS